jgi:putative heme iron utilization protein
MSLSDATPNDTQTINMGGHAVPVAIGSAAAELMAQLPPLVEVPEAPLRSAAEEARTILAANVTGALATLTADGDPWASIVTYGVLADGSPVFSLSTLAAHGRNLKRDRRASLAVSETVPPARDPADSGRVTVAGVAEEPVGDRLEEARRVYEAAVSSAAIFGGFGDFTWWVLRVERVRWVGGFGRMDSVGPESFAGAEADPVAPGAAAAIAHLNADHGDALLLIARTLSGHTDAEQATCVGADRHGLDLHLSTPRGRTAARVGFAEPVGEPDGLRGATVALVARARELG